MIFFNLRKEPAYSRKNIRNTDVSVDEEKEDEEEDEDEDDDDDDVYVGYESVLETGASFRGASRHRA